MNIYDESLKFSEHGVLQDALVKQLKRINFNEEKISAALQDLSINRFISNLDTPNGKMTITNNPFSKKSNNWLQFQDVTFWYIDSIKNYIKFFDGVKKLFNGEFNLSMIYNRDSKYKLEQHEWYKHNKLFSSKRIAKIENSNVLATVRLSDIKKDEEITDLKHLLVHDGNEVVLEFYYIEKNELYIYSKVDEKHVKQFSESVQGDYSYHNLDAFIKTNKIEYYT